jgi:phosphoglycerate dehydrogenase-like enzyme
MDAPLRSTTATIVAVVPDDFDRVYLATPHLDRLRRRGEVHVHVDPPRDEAELTARLAPATILIPIRDRTRLTAARLAAMPVLRLVSMTGTGVASVDVPAATARGILVTNTPAQSVPAVAELAFGLAIGLLRRLPAVDAGVRQGQWPRPIGRELAGKTLAVLGFGAIGRRVAELGRAFDMRVVAWSRSLTPEAARAAGIAAVPVDELFAIADVLTVQLRLTAETRGFVSRERLARMKPTAVLINTARGGLVDEAALHDALAGGRLGGAGLDVFGEEPLPPGHRWGSLENVVLASHRGGMTHETLDRFMAGAVDNALAFLDGVPRNVVNPSALDR